MLAQLERLRAEGMQDSEAQDDLEQHEKAPGYSTDKMYVGNPYLAGANDLLKKFQEGKMRRRAADEKKANKEKMNMYATKRQEEEEAQHAKRQQIEDSWKNRDYALREQDQRSRARHREVMEGVAKQGRLDNQNYRMAKLAQQKQQPSEEDKTYNEMSKKITDPQQRLKFLANPRKHAHKLRNAKREPRGVLEHIMGAVGKKYRDPKSYELEEKGKTGSNIRKAGRSSLLHQARKLDKKRRR